MQLTTPLKTLTLAVVASLAGVSTVGATSLPNPQNPDTSGVLKIVMSGASAPDGFIKSAVEDMLQPGFKTYRDNGPGAFQYRAWYGLAKADIPGVPVNTPILFVKRSKGGSAWGINPVARASRIESLDFSTCTATTTGGFDYLCGTRGLDPDSPDFTNPSLNNGVVSDMGVSDLPPAMFKAPYNVEFGQSELGDAEVRVLTVKPVNTLMMGFAVTDSVPATTRITRTDYGNMLMGNIQDWTQIDPSLTGNTQVVVCRRVDGSGTQASYNWYFNNFPCQTAFNGTVAPTTMGRVENNDPSTGGGNNDSGIVGGSGTRTDPYLIDPSAGYTVVNNSTSGDVRNCLMRANAGQDHLIRGDDGYWYKILFSMSGKPYKAIGVLSLDSYNSENGWSFRTMDGYGKYYPGNPPASTSPRTGLDPSKENLLTGAWDFAVELTMQYRHQEVDNPQGDRVAPLSGMKLAFADELIKRSGDPNQIANNLRGKAYAALPDYYDPNVYQGQVALGSRKGNMCAPLQRRY